MTGNGVGRPRHLPARRSGATGREQILDAAAELFVEHGFSAASTRQIAEAVGVKQASIYYYFGSKQEILGVLLEGTVRPSLSFSRRLAHTDEPPHVQLYALIHFDVRLLMSAPWNVGALYTLPEIRSQHFAAFRHERDLLRQAYGRRIAAGLAQQWMQAADAEVATSLTFALAESVIAMRAHREALNPELPDLIAASALRMLGCADEDVTGAATRCRERQAVHDAVPLEPSGSG